MAPNGVNPMIHGHYEQVTVAELIRQFAHWRKHSERKPVCISNHGHITHVLMGIDAFSSLSPKDGLAIGEEPDADPTHLPIGELIEWLPLGVLICDEHLVVRQVSRTLLSMTSVKAEAVIEQSLWTTFPALVGTLFQTYIQRVLSSGEPCSADLPSPFRNDHWLQLGAFPLGGGVCIMLRDITEEVMRHRLADVKEAIFQAMNIHGDIGYMRLTARGTIDRIDEPLCRMVGLPAKRLYHAQAVDLVPIHARVIFRQNLEQVLTGRGSTHFSTELMCNGGGVIHVHCAMAELRGVYGGEGCVVLLTPDASASSSPASELRSARH